MITATQKCLPRDLVVLFSIVALGVVLRMLVFSGYVGGDDSAQIALAYLYSQGNFEAPETHWGARLLPVLLTAASFRMFGVSEFSVAIAPFLFSLCGLVVTYLLGRKLFDNRVALLAVFLMAIYPLDAIYASHLFPLVFVSTLCALAVYVFLVAEDRADWKLYLLVGIVVGFAYSSRVTALFIGLFFCAYVIWRRRFSFMYLVSISGFFLVLAFETLFFVVVSGNPLLRLEILAGRNPVAGVVDSAEVGTDVDLAWFVEPLVRPLTEQEIGLFFLFVLFVVFRGVFRRSPTSVYVLLLWMIPVFLYTAYGSVSLSDYVTLRRLPRYLGPISIPSMILIAWQLLQIRRRLVSGLLLASLVASSSASLLLDGSRYATGKERLVAQYVREHSSQQIVLPRPIFFNTAFFLGFQLPSNVSLYAKPNDQSHMLRRTRLVYPGIESTEATNFSCSQYVLTAPGYIDAAELPKNAQLKDTIKKPDSLRSRLLRNEQVIDLVSKVRDPARARSLARAAKREISHMYFIAC